VDPPIHSVHAAHGGVKQPQHLPMESKWIWSFIHIGGRAQLFKMLQGSTGAFEFSKHSLVHHTFTSSPNIYQFTKHSPVHLTFTSSADIRQFSALSTLPNALIIQSTNCQRLNKQLYNECTNEALQGECE
jgi:hypothetical protein